MEKEKGTSFLREISDCCNLNDRSFCSIVFFGGITVMIRCTKELQLFTHLDTGPL
jgi:hypothetical protein